MTHDDIARELRAIAAVIEIGPEADRLEACALELESLRREHEDLRDFIKDQSRNALRMLERR